MQPFTAGQLKISKRNVIKDFVSISSYLNVTHLAIFTKTDKAPYFRLCRMPRGPTITYKVLEYTLSHDVISATRRPHINTTLFQNSPLLVLNGFSNNEDVKFQLMTSMWRNMFPSIDIHKAELGKVKRCVLLNYDADNDCIELRHYAIKVKPCGLSRTVKKLLTSKKIPDFGQFVSVDDAVAKTQMAEFTESEGEADAETSHVTLPQNIHSRGNMLNERSSIRMIELGPRMKLKLVKIEEGIMTGEVLYHSFITKTKAEQVELKKKAEQKTFLRMSRKREQEQNVKRKLEQKQSKLPKPKRQFVQDSNQSEAIEDSDQQEENFSDYQLSDDEMMPLDDVDEQLTNQLI